MIPYRAASSADKEVLFRTKLTARETFLRLSSARDLM